MTNLLKLSVILLLGVMIGCAKVPIKNMEDIPITISSGRTVSLEEVRASIVKAGVALGWEMKVEGSNQLLATLKVREHITIVDIFYTETTYSIKYRSSTNLGEQYGKIHRNYITWISQLSKNINAQFTF
ncbi:MAG: hypothetical protein ACOYMH_12825 [Zwartia sp.]